MRLFTNSLYLILCQAVMVSQGYSELSPEFEENLKLAESYVQSENRDIEKAIVLFEELFDESSSSRVQLNIAFRIAMLSSRIGTTEASEMDLDKVKQYCDWIIQKAKPTQLVSLKAHFLLVRAHQTVRDYASLIPHADHVIAFDEMSIELDPDHVLNWDESEEEELKLYRRELRVYKDTCRHARVCSCIHLGTDPLDRIWRLENLKREFSDDVDLQQIAQEWINRFHDIIHGKGLTY